MDIPKIYHKQSQKYLNSSLVALVPAILFSFVFLFIFYEKQLVLFILPFLFYSFYLFQGYVNNKNKSILAFSEEVVVQNRNNFAECNQFVLFFSKDENELLFFQTSGTILGKMIQKRTKKGLPRMVQLVDHQDKPLATYYLGSDYIDVYINSNGYIGSMYSNEKIHGDGSFQVLSGETIGYLESNKWFMDVHITNKHQQVVLRIQKGLMPVDLQKLFINPNSPILSMNSTLVEEEKLLYLASIVKRHFKA